MQYHIVYEKAPRNYCAYSPDLPGCIAVGDTLEETRRVMRKSVQYHTEDMRAQGLSAPKPTGYYEDFSKLPVRVVAHERRRLARPSSTRRAKPTGQRARSAGR